MINNRLINRFWVIAVILSVLAPAAPGVSAEPARTMTAVWRPDDRFPEFMPLWREGWNWRDENGNRVRYANEGMPLGGYVFAYFQNTGGQTLEIQDVLVEGVSLARAIAFEKQVELPGRDAAIASLQFSRLPRKQIDALAAAGEPVWWKVEPATIAPGGMAELTIRLRRPPKSDSLKLTVPIGDGKSQDVRLDVRKQQPRFFGISFTQELDRVHAYLRHPSGKGVPPERVLIDGRDVTPQSTIVADEAVDTVPVIIGLAEPFREGSYHVFAAEYADGSIAQACVGAWSHEMVYGMWGCTQSGSPEEAARTYIADLAAHNVNVFMIHCGGPAGEYLGTPEGLKLMESHGIRYMRTWPSPERNPIFYFLIDEPDAADFRSTMLDPYKRIGSRGQSLVERCKLFRRHDPHVRPILLNVDNTFKPENWYTYAQLADIPCADPYYQEGVQSVWACDPTNMGAYLKPTYVYAVGEIYQSAGAPNPMHLILHTCRFDFKPEEFPYRAPTPEEKRVEVFYALAAGAKQLSYWWYSPGHRYYGVGGDAPEMKALWKEIGLLGAEVRTIGNLAAQGCPATLVVKGPDMLWVRSLVTGSDAAVLLVVNDNMASDRLGTVVKPLENVRLEVQLPGWLESASAFEVTYEGVRDVTLRTVEGGVGFDLGTVELTRLIVLSRDEGLRARLQNHYEQKFATNVQRLLSQQ